MYDRAVYSRCSAYTAVQEPVQQRVPQAQDCREKQTWLADGLVTPTKPILVDTVRGAAWYNKVIVWVGTAWHACGAVEAVWCVRACIPSR